MKVCLFQKRYVSGGIAKWIAPGYEQFVVGIIAAPKVMGNDVICKYL